MIAELIDLGDISGAIDKYSGDGHRLSGDIESFVFKGIIDSNETVHGEMFWICEKLSVLDRKTGLYLLKDVFMQSDLKLKGKDC